jgi:hypothetical protein
MPKSDSVCSGPTLNILNEMGKREIKIDSFITKIRCLKVRIYIPPVLQSVFQTMNYVKGKQLRTPYIYMIVYITLSTIAAKPNAMYRLTTSLPHINLCLPKVKSYHQYTTTQS